MNNGRIAIVAVAVGLLIVSAPVGAHHSAAAFDVTTEITLKGTVTEWLWSNPHCLLLFDVTDDSGQVAHWVAETQNPRNMTNRGWARSSFKPGDQVTITVHPARNGGPFGRLLKVVLPSGQALS